MSDLDQYIPMIRAILSVLDLHQVTAKKIRGALQALFGVDLSDKKKELSTVIMEEYHKLQAKQEREKRAREEREADSSGSDLIDDASTTRKKKSKKNGKSSEKLTTKLYLELNPNKARGLRKYVPSSKERPLKSRSDSNNPFMKPRKLSEALRTLLGAEEEALPRPEVVKRLWKYIKEKDLQDSSDRRMIVCDERMAPVFGERVSMFSMNKVLVDHLFPLDGEESSGDKSNTYAEKDILKNKQDSEKDTLKVKEEENEEKEEEEEEEEEDDEENGEVNED